MCLTIPCGAVYSIVWHSWNKLLFQYTQNKYFIPDPFQLFQCSRSTFTHCTAPVPASASPTKACARQCKACACQCITHKSLCPSVHHSLKPVPASASFPEACTRQCIISKPLPISASCPKTCIHQSRQFLGKILMPGRWRVSRLLYASHSDWALKEYSLKSAANFPSFGIILGCGLLRGSGSFARQMESLQISNFYPRIVAYPNITVSCGVNIGWWAYSYS